MSVKGKTINVRTILGILAFVVIATNIFAMGVQNTNALTIVSVIGPVTHDTNNQCRYSNTYLKINGPGYFIVRDPYNDTLYVTRNGSFRIGGDGFIVYGNGFRLQGITNHVSNAIGDLTLTKRFVEGLYNIGYNSINIDTNGIITETITRTLSFAEYLNNVTEVIDLIDAGYAVDIKDVETTYDIVGQIVLKNITQPETLRKIDYGLYFQSAESVNINKPGCEGVGYIESAALDDCETVLTVIKPPPLGSGHPFVQGEYLETNEATDLSINGQGYFIVRNAKTNERLATRIGAFRWDREGYLATYTGERVQGYSFSNVNESFDIKASSPSEGPNNDYWIRYSGIDWQGTITCFFSDRTPVVVGTLCVYTFLDPENIIQIENGFYSGVDIASPKLVSSISTSGDRPFIFSGKLENTSGIEEIWEFRKTFNIFSDRIFEVTGDPFDMTIYGTGHLLLREPLNGQIFATSGGHFTVDSNGYIQNALGMRIQGYTYPDLTNSGDIKIVYDHLPIDFPTGAIQSTNIETDGRIMFVSSNKTEYACAQIRMQLFRDPQALIPFSEGVYSGLKDALPLSVEQLPAWNGMGYLMSRVVQNGFVSYKNPSERSGINIVVKSGLEKQFSLEASIDFIEWKAIGQIYSNEYGESSFKVTKTIDSPNLFYRARLLFPVSNSLTTIP